MYYASAFTTQMLQQFNANITIRPLKPEEVRDFFVTHPIDPCDSHDAILDDGDSIIIATYTPKGTKWALVVVRHPK